MDPIVEAALISGGWATAVAALGYRFNVATIRSADANAINAVDASHQAQLWEKRAEAYVDVMTAIERRKARRDYPANPAPKHDDKTRDRIAEEMLAPAAGDDWARMSARINVYATRPVWHAMVRASMADQQVNARLMHHRSLVERLQVPTPDAPDGEDIGAALEAVQKTAKAANEADAELTAAIQAELERRPSVALARPPAPEPPAWRTPDQPPREPRRRRIAASLSPSRALRRTREHLFPPTARPRRAQGRNALTVSGRNSTKTGRKL